MKLIDPSATIIDRPINQLKLVEEIGRTCYKSNDLITEDSYKSFCNGLLNRKHFAMLEHCVFHFVIQKGSSTYNTIESNKHLNAYQHMVIDYLMMPCESEDVALITANLRAILESNNSDLINELLCKYEWLQQLDEKYKVTYRTNKNIQILDEKELKQYLCDNDDFYNSDYYYKKHHIITVKFVCNRAISHELVRHRPCSFAQVSQRYVNYSKDKFGNEIPFIKSPFYKPSNTDSSYIVWLECCKRIEQDYFKLLRLGHKPEEARGVLSNDVATEIYVTATGEEWQHIINLRAFDATGKAHPQMKEIMLPLAQKLIDMNIGFYNPREVEQDVSR